ncbi:MAG: ergothioneine biosynthesis protein EgtB [Gammaproteobacteria bacterium]|nr:ergothioneine biosynthesis protein EgtB [Gammaproteobacteria bacterium]
MAEAQSAARRAVAEREDVARHYRKVRQATEALCEPLATEDYGLQTMPDVSPVKWHIAHTSWFFETFILLPNLRTYPVFDPAFDHLFNSYYLTHGTPFLRAQRGFLSRPTVARVQDYRRAVDDAMLALIAHADSTTWRRVEPLLELGLNHEQQHQELILTDLKHAFAHNPLWPAYRSDLRSPPLRDAPPQGWCELADGLIECGHAGPGFAYDNEQPRHRVWLGACAIAQRPVTNAEYLEFIDDGGYREPRWWLSEGWSTLLDEGWRSPLYWQRRDDEWWQFTLGGMRPLDPAAPVCHVSHFEADAFAAWAGQRLPREAEWEACAQQVGADPRAAGTNLRDADHLQPVAAAAVGAPNQLFGDVWEWTASPYIAYPGFRRPDGPVGEYNGKFMSGQLVLRGGSCATPADHIRASYRNFFHPGDRWQFSGIRLAEDR